MDSLLIKEKRIKGAPAYLAVVCDGVGSLEGGGFAAATAVQQLGEWFDSVEDTRRIGLAMQERIVRVNSEIIGLASARGLDTASTLSALLLVDGRFYTVHAGDSRIYALENGTLTQLTEDHSRDGMLASCIGRWEDPTIDYNEGPLEGQRFLLCSDGLYKQAEAARIADLLGRMTRRSIGKTAEKLAKHAIDRGETDNITLAILMKES